MLAVAYRTDGPCIPAGYPDPGPVRLRAAGALERRSRSCPACVTTATSRNAMRWYPGRRVSQPLWGLARTRSWPRIIAAHSGVADLP